MGLRSFIKATNAGRPWWLNALTWLLLTAALVLTVLAFVVKW